MDGEMVKYIVVGIIISVMVNLVFWRLLTILQLTNQRDRTQRVPTARPRPVPGSNQRTRQGPINPPTRRRPTSRPGPQTIVRSPEARTNGTPPPVAPKRRTTTNRKPEDFPRCPVCRNKNRTGQEQLIFWDAQGKQWRCLGGHTFKS